MQYILLILQIILWVSFFVFLGGILQLILLKSKLYWATHDLSKLLKNSYPQIRSCIWLKRSFSYISDSLTNWNNFIDKFYIQPHRLIKSFGSRAEVENFYRSVIDIDAIMLTHDTILISKMERLFWLFQSLIRTITICFLVFFIGLILPQGLLQLFSY